MKLKNWTISYDKKNHDINYFPKCSVWDVWQGSKSAFLPYLKQFEPVLSHCNWKHLLSNPGTFLVWKIYLNLNSYINKYLRYRKKYRLPFFPNTFYIWPTISSISLFCTIFLPIIHWIYKIYGSFEKRYL